MSKQNKKIGFSVVEVIIAAAVLSIFISGLTAAYIGFARQIRSSGHKQQASLLSEEALEAVRNIRDNSYTNITDGTFGISYAANQWNLTGTNDTNGIYTRQVTISTINSNQKQVTSTVTWRDNNISRSVSSGTYLTNWQASVGKSGMLVYGNGTTTGDSIVYKIFDPSGTWGSASLTSDIDPATTNKALRAVSVFSSQTRSEKIIISKHFDGSTQYIYAQVYNGSTWGSVQLLSNFSSIANLNVKNFDAAYLANGDFIVVYSDNTTVPKMRTFNGSAWSSQISLNSLSGIPNWVVLKVRPSSNEVMAAILDLSSRSTTQYFNGGSYITSNWSAVTTHSTAVPSTAHHTIDFLWSQNSPLKGALIYADSATDRAVTSKVFTANGSGSGSFSGAVNSASQPTGRLLSDLKLAANAGSAEFSACDEDSTASPNIYCFKLSTVPSFTTPTNNTIASPSDNGGQRAYSHNYESLSGSTALIVYSDGSTSAKLKKYAVSTATWDASQTSIGSLGGILKTANIYPYPNSDDAMIVMGDSNQTVYTEVWDGSTNQIYSTPASKTLTVHGSLGSSSLDYWYDFAWDN